MKFNPSMLASVLVSSSVLLLLGACNEHPTRGVVIAKQEEVVDTVAVAANRKVDVIFVIDDSISMGEEQAGLTKTFPLFINALEDEEVNANYRIGIVTTSMKHRALGCDGSNATGGKLRLSSCLERENDFATAEFSRFNTACQSQCQLSESELEQVSTSIQGGSQAKVRPWIERVNGVSNLKDADVSTAEAFSCFAPQGISGCGLESPVSALSAALKRMHQVEDPSYGFLRDDAHLAIVFLTDELDCSFNFDAKDTSAQWDAFDKKNSTLWVPGQSSTTSANCWRAGVRCEDPEAGEYAKCTAVDVDADGSVISVDLDDEDSRKAALDSAILTPIWDQISLLQEIEDAKKKKDPSREVIVALIGGMADKNEVVYRVGGEEGTADEEREYEYFGVGFGCTSRSTFLAEKNPTTGEVEPGGVADGFAIAPVRLRQLAEAFSIEERDPLLYSICEESFAEPMSEIAEILKSKIDPGCYPGCVLDSDAETGGVQPDCTVYEQSLNEELTPVEECEREGKNGPYVWKDDAFSIPDDESVCYVARGDKDDANEDEHDDLSQYCVDQSRNLQFEIIRKPGVEAEPGSVVRVSCLLDTRPASCAD